MFHERNHHSLLVLIIIQCVFMVLLVSDCVSRPWGLFLLTGRMIDSYMQRGLGKRGDDVIPCEWKEAVR